MRPILVTLAPAAAPAVTTWIPINYLQTDFAVALAGILSSGASLTWQVQHTFDDDGPQGLADVKITRAGTVATVTHTNHHASVGDSIVVIGTGSTNLDGTYDIASIVDANTYTYTVANSGATADIGSSRLNLLRVFTHATLTGQTGRADGNYAFPVRACRARVTVWASGTLDFLVLQGLGH